MRTAGRCHLSGGYGGPLRGFRGPPCAPCVRGYLGKVDVGRVTAFEAQYMSELKAREPGILEAIRNDREIKPEVEKKLTGFLDNFAKSFT